MGWERPTAEHIVIPTEVGGGDGDITDGNSVQYTFDDNQVLSVEEVKIENESAATLYYKVNSTTADPAANATWKHGTIAPGVSDVIPYRGIRTIAIYADGANVPYTGTGKKLTILGLVSVPPG